MYSAAILFNILCEYTLANRYPRAAAIIIICSSIILWGSIYTRKQDTEKINSVNMPCIPASLQADRIPLNIKNDSVVPNSIPFNVSVMIGMMYGIM